MNRYPTGPNIPAYRQPLAVQTPDAGAASDLSPQLDIRRWASSPKLRQAQTVYEARPLNATDTIRMTNFNETSFTYEVPLGYNLVVRGLSINFDVRSLNAATPVTDAYGWINPLISIGTSILVDRSTLAGYPVFNTDWAILGTINFPTYFLAQPEALVQVLFNVQPSANFAMQRCKLMMHANLILDTGSPLQEEPIVSPDFNPQLGLVP